MNWRLASTITAILILLFGIQTWAQPNGPPFDVAIGRQSVVWLVWLGLVPFASLPKTYSGSDVLQRFLP